MKTIENRVQTAMKIYPFLDELTLEDVFEEFGKALPIKIKELNLSTALKRLHGFGFDDSEVINFVKVWNETEQDVDIAEVAVDPIIINGKEMEVIIIDTKRMGWGRGANIEEAKKKLCISIGDFFDCENKEHQIWLVNKGTTVNGMGGFNYPTEAIAPVKIS